VTYFYFAAQPYSKINLVLRFDNPGHKTLKVIGRTRFFLKVNKIWRVGHSNLFLFRGTTLPQDDLGTTI